MSELVLEKNEDLPSGWLICKLDDITKQVNSGFPSGKHNKSQKGIPHIRPMNIDYDGNIDLSEIKYVEVDDYDKLRNGDVLFNNTNSPKLLGKTTVIKEDTNWAYSNHMTRIRLDASHIEPKWISFYLHKLFWEGYYKLRATNHVNQSSINSTFLSKHIPILLAPLNEQKRIVAKIEELFSKIESTLESLKEIKIRVHQYRISLIKWIFFGTYKQKFSFSSSWKQGTVGDFFAIVGGGTPSTKNSKYWGGKIPWISSADIFGIKDIRPRRTVTQLGIDDSTTNIIPKNSILVVTRVGLGKLAISEQDICINQDIQALIPHNSAVYSFFALHYLSEMVQIFRYQSRGTTINGVTKKQLSELPFSLPSINEQKKIVDFIEMQLTELSHIRQIAEKNFFILNSMKNAILKQAFEGKLVSQDPNDEPAEILLQKIKQEKQKIIKETKPRKKKNDK